MPRWEIGVETNRDHADIRIGIAGVNESFTAKRGMTVLQALAPAHHRLIASGCHGGGCGVCRIRIVSGEFEVGAMSRTQVSVEDEAMNIALACRAWPRTHLVIEPLGKRFATLGARTPPAGIENRRDNAPALLGIG